MTSTATTSRSASKDTANVIGANTLRATGADYCNDLAALTLDARGMIRYCSQAAESLFRYRRGELVWQHVSLLLPQLADLELTRNGELNPRLRFLFHIGRTFEVVAKTGERFEGELFINILDSEGAGRLSLIVNSVAEPGPAAPDGANGASRD